MNCRQKYAKYHNIVNSTNTKNTKIRTWHQIDNFTDRMGSIIDNFEEKMNQDDKKTMKNTVNKELHLTGIMTQYITEFGSRSDVWVQ